jgi:hypothetical protein
MVNVIAKQTQIRSKIDDFGSTIVIIPVTRTFSKFGDKTETLGIAIDTVGIPYNNLIPDWMRNAFGDTPINSNLMIVKDNESITIGDIVVYSDVDYEVIKIEDFPLKDTVLAKQLTLTQKTYNTTDLTTGLVGFWKMTEGTGTTIADSSGLANTGTIIQGTQDIIWSSSTPNSTISGSLFFPNTATDIDSEVNFGDDTDFEMGSSPFTISAWINVPDWIESPFARDIFSKSELSGNKFEYVFFGWTNGITNTGGLALETTNTGNGTNVSINTMHSINNIMIPNTWYHVIVVKIGTVANFYINGKLIPIDTTQNTVVASTVFTGTAPARIGSEGIFGVRTFLRGNITYVRCYNNRGLTSYEARYLYLKDSGII